MATVWKGLMCLGIALFIVAFAASICIAQYANTIMPSQSSITANLDLQTMAAKVERHDVMLLQITKDIDSLKDLTYKVMITIIGSTLSAFFGGILTAIGYFKRKGK